MSATTDLLIEYAEHAGLSITSLAQAKLAPRTRTLHRAVLGAFLDTGIAPSSGWLRQRAAELGLDPDAALVELADTDLVHVNDDLVVVAYPFSGVATTDQVQLAGGPPLWAMCALDALGVLLMTGRDGVITPPIPEMASRSASSGSENAGTGHSTALSCSSVPAKLVAARPGAPALTWPSTATPSESRPT
jgi:alkylmercury lyase